MAKEYFGIHSLRSLIRLLQADLGTKVGYDDIVDNLTTDDPNKVLSAAQGKILGDKLDSFDVDGSGVVGDSAKLGGHEPSYYATAGQLEQVKAEVELVELSDETLESLWNES